MPEEFDSNLEWTDLWVNIGWIDMCFFIVVIFPYTVWQYKQMNLCYGTDVMDFRHPTFYYPIFIVLCFSFNVSGLLNSLTLITKSELALACFVVRIFFIYFV